MAVLTINSAVWGMVALAGFVQGHRTANPYNILVAAVYAIGTAALLVTGLRHG